MTVLSAVFHGVEIPECLLATELQHHRAATLSQARTLAGRALATKAVLLARARELDLRVIPERNSQGQEETLDEALIRAVLNEEVEVEPTSDAEIWAVYDSNPDGFMSPPLLEASHILLAPADESPGALEAARRKADMLIAELQANPSGFTRMAATQSACPSASEGGSLGQLRPGDVLPVIWTALIAMETQSIGSKPVPSEHGWHILRLDHRTNGERLPLDYVRPHIAMQLEARSWTRSAARYVEALLAKSVAKPGLCLSENGQLEYGHGVVARVDGLLGNALSDAKVAYEVLSEATRARLDQAAAREGRMPSDYLSGIIGTYLSQADDEAWTQLISRLRDSQDPLTDSLELIAARQLPPQQITHTLIKMRSGKQVTA